MVNTDNRKEEIGAHAVVSTTKGWIAILASPRGIQRLSLPHSDPSEALSSLEMPESSAGGELDPETLGGLGRRLELYFSGERAAFPDDLGPEGNGLPEESLGSGAHDTLGRNSQLPMDREGDGQAPGRTSRGDRQCEPTQCPLLYRVTE